MGPDPSLLKRILAPFITFVVGVVLGPLLLQGVIDAAVNRWSSVYLALIFVCMVVISVMVFLLMMDAADLRQRVGIKIRYVEKDPSRGRQRIFDEVTKVVSGAKSRIYVVTSCVLKRSFGGRPSVDKYEQDYYSSILSCVKRKDLVYERVLQLREQDQLRDLFSTDDGLPKHMWEMLEEKLQNRNSKISLTRVKAQRFTSFVLIDDIYLIWQINEFLEPDEKLEMQGVFIIEDPGMEITRHFTTFFFNLRNFTPHYAVELSELPSIDPTVDPASQGSS